MSEPPKLIQCDNNALRWTATEMVAEIAAGNATSESIVTACLDRIATVNSDLNAFSSKRFEQAVSDAKAADEKIRSGDTVGPLHGVPITIKDNIDVAQLPSTIGITCRANHVATDDAVIVKRLKQAGAIILGKSNVPQLMISHETTNPLHGTTNNPWDIDRTPGGSSGGEAALVASHCSPLGIGTDLGGSIRVPCHFAGLYGFKPTSGYLPLDGIVRNFLGMQAISVQPGPMARCVQDLETALAVMHGRTVVQGAQNSPPMRIAYWADDRYYTPCSAVGRAVKEAAEHLRNAGHQLVEFAPPDVERVVHLFFTIAGADGGKNLRRLLGGDKPSPNVAQLLQLAGLPKPLRVLASKQYRRKGQTYWAPIIAAAGAKTADQYWQLVNSLDEYKQSFYSALKSANCDAMLCPAYGLPAPPHGNASELMPAAAPALLMNMLDVPAGVVPVTQIRADETTPQVTSKDRVHQCGAATLNGAEGLPVGVQLAAIPNREDIVLQLMKDIEKATSIAS